MCRPWALEFPHQVRCLLPDATSGVPRLEGLLPTSGSFSYWKLTPESSVLGLNLPLSLFQPIFVCVCVCVLIFKEMHHPSSRQWLPVFLSQVNECCTLNVCAPWACWSSATLSRSRAGSHGPPTVRTELLSLQRDPCPGLRLSGRSPPAQGAVFFMLRAVSPLSPPSQSFLTK